MYLVTEVGLKGNSSDIQVNLGAASILDPGLAVGFIEVADRWVAKSRGVWWKLVVSSTLRLGLT